MTSSVTATPSPGLSWSWSHALVGAVYALPAAVVALQDPEKGLPLAVGVIPAVLIGIPARRPTRVVIVLVGVIAGVSMFVGGAISHLPTLATGLLLGAAVIGAAVLSAKIPRGRVVLTFCVPLIAIGLSFEDWATSFATVVLLIGGAVYAWLVSLLWPEGSARPRPTIPLPAVRVMAGYGARLGAAAALGYLIAAGLGLDHPGWAPAACLLVARPQLDLLQSRGVGRVASVAVGAFAAAFVLALDPADVTYAVLAIVVLASASATAGSRWYVTAGFTTFFVILMLASGDEAEAVSKTNERVFETIIGVALAYLFGWALPGLMSRRTPGNQGGAVGV